MCFIFIKMASTWVESHTLAQFYPHSSMLVKVVATPKKDESKIITESNKLKIKSNPFWIVFKSWWKWSTPSCNIPQCASMTFTFTPFTAPFRWCPYPSHRGDIHHTHCKSSWYLTVSPPPCLMLKNHHGMFKDFPWASTCGRMYSSFLASHSKSTGFVFVPRIRVPWPFPERGSLWVPSPPPWPCGRSPQPSWRQDEALQLWKHRWICSM